MTRSLAGQTILDAGASSGMGRAVAVAAAGQGARLVLLARTAAELSRTALACEAAGGRDLAAVTIAADATDAAALERAVAPHAAAIASANVLVTAVGTNIVDRAFDQLTPQSWSGMLDANLTAAFNLTRLVLLAMRQRANGLIIHIASTAARKPDRSGAAYQAAKAGVVALTHAVMEEEWQHGIRATAILPVMTDTPLLDRRPIPVGAEARAAALKPEDVAAACLFVIGLPARAHVTELLQQPNRH